MTRSPRSVLRPEEVLSETMQRTSRDRVQPDPRFQPRTAKPEEICKYGLSPRPNAETQPRALEAWLQAVDPTITIVQPEFRVDRQPMDWQLHNPSAADTGSQPPAFGAASGMVAPGALATSNNWSGVVVDAPAIGRLSRVQGGWIVPDPYPYRARTGASWPDGRWRSATWIGFDGFRHDSTSLPQIGTAQFVTALNGSLEVETFAWTEWWSTTVAAPPMPIPNFLVRPGDFIWCELLVISPNEVTYQMYNRNSRTACGSTFLAPPPAPNTDPTLVQVKALTADWIMERPTPLGANTPDTLASYGATVFCQALALVDPVSGNGAELDLNGGTLVTMRDPSDPASPNVVVSTPALVSDSMAMTFYRGNGP